MSNSTDPLETEPLFQGGLRGRAVVAAMRFRCGVCNALVVDEPGQVCGACAAPAKPRTTTAGTRSTARRPRRNATGGGVS
jgi:hypothetical protein